MQISFVKWLLLALVIQHVLRMQTFVLILSSLDNHHKQDKNDPVIKTKGNVNVFLFGTYPFADKHETTI